MKGRNIFKYIVIWHKKNDDTGIVEPKYVSSAVQLADLLTKSLGRLW